MTKNNHKKLGFFNCEKHEHFRVRVPIALTLFPIFQAFHNLHPCLFHPPLLGLGELFNNIKRRKKMKECDTNEKEIYRAI